MTEQGSVDTKTPKDATHETAPKTANAKPKNDNKADDNKEDSLAANIVMKSCTGDLVNVKYRYNDRFNGWFISADYRENGAPCHIGNVSYTSVDGKKWRVFTKPDKTAKFLALESEHFGEWYRDFYRVEFAVDPE